jgi:hypothetical protein
MTAALIIYYALLVLWLPLLWPMLRLRRGARLSLAVVVGAGLAAALYEIRMTLGTASAIRLDILLIGGALLGLYGLAAVVLFAAGWRRAAAALGLVVLLIGGSAAYEWVLLGRESERLTEVFHARNALLFEAGFRDRETYERRFGPVAGAAGSHPTGHWLADGPSRFSRLIVNGEGRVWLFYRCGETECAYGPGGSGLQPTDAAPASRWQATLAPRAGVPLDVTIAREDGDRLTLRTSAGSTVFAEAPPPIDPAPARSSLVFLGSFARVTCQGQHAKVRQAWLWREDSRLYAVGIFATLVAGRHAGFVQPVLLGEGARAGEAWTFEWARNGRSWTATIALNGPEAILTLVRDGQETERAVLEAPALFHDEAIDLAPLTAKADWDHWFDIVLTGHFSSGDIPAC